MENRAPITLIGAEGSGKTTMCHHLATKFNGVHLVVPTWPTLELFLKDPLKHAFTSQFEAMEYTSKIYRDAIDKKLGPIFIDNCPDRIHLVHSWRLHNQGIISDYEWEILNIQYKEVSSIWSKKYIYLHANLATLAARLSYRNRREDTRHNLFVLPDILERWSVILNDSDWCRNKDVLMLNSEYPIENIIKISEQWINKSEIY